MSGLQETFYVMGIVFMSVMFLMILALLVAVFVIRAKINRIHDNIEAKLDTASMIAEKGGELVGKASTKVARKARRVLRKR